MVGWDAGSWGYHGDDGKIFKCRGYGDSFGEKFQAPDVIGCGIDFDKKIAFSTKNGELRGTFAWICQVKLGLTDETGPAFEDIKGRLYPAVSFSAVVPGASVSVNFGSEKFAYEDWKSPKNTEGALPKEAEPDSDSDFW
jgi:Ran-binding protein 9/10